ncbi:DUF479 domain-containing protein [Oculatella sp. LEGE 06141]|nr:DUF479 domain-containing protein [Oculatella sp. LEGE 06141]
MNYLAHLYLANNNSGLLIGSILGDFVKGSISTLYTPEIRAGIDLHRKVDSYTDSHQVVHASKRIVAPSRRRFAGIMVDLFYDHFLAKNWHHYSTVSLYDFSHHVYTVLAEHQAILPDALKQILPHMIEQNWLMSYREINHVNRALNGISRRFKRQNNLFNSAEELEWNYASFEQDFQLFFPDLIHFVEHYKRSLILA